MRKSLYGAIACLLFTLGLLAGCTSPTPIPVAVPGGAATTVGADGGARSPVLQSVPNAEERVPAATAEASTDGPIWQWAIGRNVWTDPNLSKYSQDLGRSGNTDVMVHAQGFELTTDASGVVTAVTLFNDESMLGYSASDTAFSAYRGALPGGLSWDVRAADIGALYGAENQSGGYGTDISFTYTTADGYTFQVEFVARHEADLPTSLIHDINVR